MSKREPELELLLGGGELIKLTRLDYEAQRDAMRAALRERIPQLTRRDGAEPAQALIDALAACLDVMGFYHDRILTESKLGSAQLLASVARLGAAIGYRPRPPIAATAKQFFLAAAPGTVLAGTRVGGAGAVFATTDAIDISPAVNRMELSPVLTLHAGALRAVIERLDTAATRDQCEVKRRFPGFTEILKAQAGASASLPTDELRRGMIAMLSSDHGLELCSVAASRARGVAFGRPLLRSYDEGTSLARTTRVRHLRHWQALDDSLVVFEVSELPILHLPDPAALEIITEKQSTLEIFVFDEPPPSPEDDEPLPSPEDWDRKAAWSEVLDFSASKASDRHYRTFVDDRLTTYVVLRRKLGYRTLIDDARLGRVYARYTPAVGRAVEPSSSPSDEIWNLDAVTLRLDADYLTTSLVRPKVERVVGLHNEARWAVTKDDMGLAPGAQIAILGGASGATYVRTLQETRERYVAWATKPPELPPPPGERPANELDPIDDFFDPGKGKLAPLADVARGQFYPLWEAYYKQAKKPDADWLDGPEEGTEIPPHTAKGVTEAQLEQRQQIVYLHKGSTFLLLEDASYVKAGDYLLVGRRLKGDFQNREPKPDPANPGAPANPGDPPKWFDTHKPWLTAEVVQAIEVQGNLVRLKEPVSQAYYQDRLMTSGSEPEVITEIIVVPRVASVYYGDVFTQTVKLTSQRTFIKKSSSLSLSYIEVALDTHIIDPVQLRKDLGLSGDLKTMFSTLFLAVEGRVSAPVNPSWSYLLTVTGRGMLPAQVAGIRIGAKRVTIEKEPVANGTGGLEISILDVDDAIAARNAPDDLALLPKEGIGAWDAEFTGSGPVPVGNFRVLVRPGWYFTASDLEARADLLKVGGTIFFWDDQTAHGAFAFAWEQEIPSALAMLFLKDIAPGAPKPVPPGVLDAAAIPQGHTFPVASLTWTADFRLPSGLFASATGWISNVSEGRLELQYTSSSPDFGFEISGGNIELRGVPVANPLDPLDGASAVWALPSAVAVPLTPGKVTAIWRFPVLDDVVAALGVGWSGPLAVIGPAKILLTTTVGGAAGARFLEGKLAGDVTHDLRSAPASIHALRPEAALSQDVESRQIWEWQGPPPFTPVEPEEAAAFTFNNSTDVVRLAAIWHDPGKLRLIPSTTQPAIVSEKVKTLIGYHPDPIVIQQETVDTGVITIVFGLPQSWPQTSGNDVSPALAFLGTLTPNHQEIVPVVEVSVGSGQGTLKVKGTQTGTWSEIRLALHAVSPAPSSEGVKGVQALRIIQPAWSTWIPRVDLGLFFTNGAIGSGPVSDMPLDWKHVFVHGASRADGLWFVPRDASKSFPLLGTFVVYLSPASRTNAQVTPFTALELGTPPASTALLGFLGIRDSQDHWVAHTLSASSFATPGIVEVQQPAPVLFPDGITGTAARLAYDFATHNGSPSSTGLALGLAVSANPGPFGVAGGTNRVVFHTLGDPLRAPSSSDGEGIQIEIDPKAVFTPTGAARRSQVGFGHGWEDLPADSVSEVPLTLELGPPAGTSLQLAKDDELVLIDATNIETSVPITGVTAAGAYELGRQAAPAKVRLDELHAPLQKLQIVVSFIGPAPADPPPPPLDPWLLTLGDGTIPSGDSIADTLLFHGGVRRGPDNRLEFTLDDTTKLEAIEQGKPLRYYTNERYQLHEDLYAGALTAYSGTDNFLKSVGPEAVEILFATVSAPSFPEGQGSGKRVLICATSRAKPLAEDDGYFTSGTGDREKQVVSIPVLSQSIVFHSGDFIPVTGTLEARDDKIIRNALRVWLLDRTTKAESRLVTYEPKLTKIVELFDTDISWDDIRYRLRFENIAGLDSPDPSLLLYSFNKAPGGAFTLNFLLIDAALQTEVQEEVKVYVEYFADRLPDGPEDPEDPEGRIYQFETRLDRLVPEKQLVVVDKGELKPGEYLFLHTAHAALIHWTQVRAVTGLVIDVDPPLPFEIERFRSYAVHGFSKPASPTALDKDYYKQAKEADLTNEDAPTSPKALVLADRLTLNPVAGAAVLAALVPGDRLLIWDEPHRAAWHRHRVKGSDDAGWSEWPDHQHEAVVKQVDAATGLVVLTEPLPERFAVAFSLVSHPDQDPDPADSTPWYTLEPPQGPLGLRVLPHYRAPFQGKERHMITLGSGDRSRRFARYTGELAPDPGLGTLPLADLGVYASNIEVLARDPRSGDWSRWAQFADIDRAEKKDRAFTLGVEASKIGSGQPVPFSVSFGDGISGQLLPTGDRNVLARVTVIGDRVGHVAGRRPLRILEARDSEPVPFAVPPCANAATRNLWLLVETGAPEQWRPAGGRAPWQPAMEIEVPQGGQTRRWYERSREEILLGWDGFYVQGVRPGVVAVSFFTPEPLTLDLAQTLAWEVPDAGVWIVDAAFYAELATQDLSRVPGATRLQLLETDSLAPGSLLALSQGAAGPTELLRLGAVDPETWSATLAGPLERTYAFGQAFLRGNIAPVVQGDTERVVLGSGDGTSLDLRLAVLSRAPLLFVLREGRTDPEPAIDVLVDGVPWRRVTDLDRAGPRDRVYRVDREADGRVFVAFGDGVHGAVPGPGNSNIVALVRTGNGAAGNVAAGALTRLLDGNLAVKSTVNLTEATGGRRADDVSEAREALLHQSLGLDRIVSIEDVSRVAQEVGEVSHARVDPTAPAGVLHLVVALVGRRAPTELVLGAVHERIAGLLPATAGVTLQVDGALQVPVHLVVKITTGEGYAQSQVLAALRRAFGTGPGGFFAEERCAIAEPLRLGDVYEAVFAVPGVAAAHVTWMSTAKPPPSPGAPAPDTLDPGPDGVIRCDGDPAGDPDGDNGTITFSPTSRGAS
jgi:Baseplate J-like protein